MLTHVPLNLLAVGSHLVWAGVLVWHHRKIDERIFGEYSDVAKYYPRRDSGPLGLSLTTFGHVLAACGLLAAWSLVNAEVITPNLGWHTFTSQRFVAGCFLAFLCTCGQLANRAVLRRNLEHLRTMSQLETLQRQLHEGRPREQVK